VARCNSSGSPGILPPFGGIGAQQFIQAMVDSVGILKSLDGRRRFFLPFEQGRAAAPNYPAFAERGN